LVDIRGNRGKEKFFMDRKGVAKRKTVQVRSIEGRRGGFSASGGWSKESEGGRTLGEQDGGRKRKPTRLPKRSAPKRTEFSMEEGMDDHRTSPARGGSAFLIFVTKFYRGV